MSRNALPSDTIDKTFKGKNLIVFASEGLFLKDLCVFAYVKGKNGHIFPFHY